MTSAMYSSTGAARDGSTGRIKPGYGQRQLRTLLYVKDAAYLHSALRSVRTTQPGLARNRYGSGGRPASRPGVKLPG
jgi:hypothetical protein